MKEVVFSIKVEQVGAAARIDELRTKIKELKKELSTKAKGGDEYNKQIKEIAQLSVELEDATTAQKKLQKEFNAAKFPKDSIVALRLEYSKLTEQLYRLSDADRNGAIGKKLANSAKTVKDQIDKAEQSVGRFTGNVGNYRDVLRGIGDELTGGLLTGGAVVAGVTLATGALKAGFDAATQFEEKISQLSSITGVSGKPLEDFVDGIKSLESIDLGGISFTTDGGEIADAFARIGSERPELLASADALTKVSEAALILNKASGKDDLGGAVDALTSTLGQFNLEADESTRIINEIAAASKVGSSEIPQTSAALKEFGLQANNLNISTSESITLIDLLAAKSIKGSEAGNALSNILTKISAIDALPKTAIEAFDKAGINIKKLTDTTLPLGQRLTELKKIQGDANAIVKIFDESNQAAVNALLEQIDSFDKLNDSIKGTNTAYEQARTNSDNLKTDLKTLKDEGIGLLRRAFEGLTPLIRPVIKLIGDLFRGYNLLIDELTSGEKKLGKEKFTQIRSKQDIQKDIESAKKAIQDKKSAEQIEQEKADAEKKAAENKQAAERRKQNAERAASERAQKEAERQRQKEEDEKFISDQQKRIGDALRKVEDIRIGSLDGLAQERAKAIADANASIQDLEAKIKEVEARTKSPVGSNNAGEIAAYQKLIDAEKGALDTALNDISKKQQEQLEKTLNEISNKIIENGIKTAEAQTDLINNSYDAEVDRINKASDARLQANELQFSNGIISRRAYEKAIDDIEIERTKSIIRNETERKDVLIANLAELTKIRKQEADAQRKLALSDIDKSLAADNKTAPENIAQNEELAAQKRLSVASEYKSQILDIEKDAADAITEIDNEIAENMDNLADRDLERARNNTEKQIELRKQLGQFLIDSAQQVSGALFDIERANIEAIAEQEKTKADEDYAIKIANAAGNVIEQERLAKELEEKKLAIEKEAAQKRKEIAKKEAIIQGALAIVKAAPNLFAMAQAAIATALQLALISKTTFFHGGKTGAKGVGISDRYGEIVGGVHKNEYVIPERVATKIAPYIDNVLEPVRLGKKPIESIMNGYGTHKTDVYTSTVLAGASYSRDARIDRNSISQMAAMVAKETAISVASQTANAVSTMTAEAVRGAIGDGLGDAGSRIRRESIAKSKSTL